jgi:hypothetical protein
MQSVPWNQTLRFLLSLFPPSSQAVNRYLHPNHPTPLSFCYHLCLVEILQEPQVLKWSPFPAVCCSGIIAKCKVKSFPKDRLSYCWASNLHLANQTTKGICCTGLKTHCTVHRLSSLSQQNKGITYRKWLLFSEGKDVRNSVTTNGKCCLNLRRKVKLFWAL